MFNRVISITVVIAFIISCIILGYYIRAQWLAYQVVQHYPKTDEHGYYINQLPLNIFNPTLDKQSIILRLLVNFIIAWGSSITTLLSLGGFLGRLIN